ncbi:MFS transporter [Streptomyces sp. NBC_00453]|uniref:MFS transporter n=1 Tax=Streptomyces sp. NBC_00453 TaxID=2903653 RepID=UPI002E1C33B4
MTTTVPHTSRLLSTSRGFRAMFAASAISSTGDGVRLAAFPLLALSVTSDPVAVTGLAIANRAPWLLVSLFSGALADRYNRRVLMVLVDILRAGVAGVLVLALLSGADALVILYVVAVLLGIGETLFTTASQGLLPDYVPTEHLAKANGNLFTAQMVGSNFLGPMLGSWLFGLGRAVPFIIDAISFAVGSSLLALAPSTTAPRNKADGASMLKEIREGIIWVWRHPLLRSFLMVVTVVNLTQSASQSLLVLLAVKELGMSTSAFGFLLAASGVGAFLGGMLSSRVGDRLGVPLILLPSIAATCPLFLTIAWTDQPLVLGAVLAVNSFLGLLANVQMSALRQRIVPREYLGRVASVNMFCAFGFAIPLGALGGGLLAQYTSTRLVYAGSAVVILALVLAVATSMRPSAVRKTIEQLSTREGD